MQSLIRILMVLLVPLFACTLIAQEGTSTSVQEEGSGEIMRSFPYSAEITGDNVYIRSGPGTNFYECGQLDKGDKVKVVSAQHGWCRIVPPDGSFSWISKQYVEVDPNKPKTGVITGDSVSVYTGSENVKPLYSTTRQGKLNRGDKVTLLGEVEDGYYKIEPPNFAYLWVSSRYVKAFDISREKPEEKSEPEPPEVVKTELPAQSQQLKKYYALKQKVDAERTKAIEEQNYESIKKELRELAGDKQAGKAARYAEFTLRRIKRYELALQVDKQLKLQEKKLEEVKSGIEQAREQKLSRVKDLGKYAAIGTLRVSYEIYGYYRLVDATGKNICYASAVGNAENMNLERFLGKRVGLVGSILPHQDSQEALVKFADIAIIE